MRQRMEHNPERVGRPSEREGLWDQGRTYTSRKGKLQIVGAESIIVYGGLEDFGQEGRFAEEVFGYAEPEAEKLVKGDNVSDIFNFPIMHLEKITFM